MLLTSLFELTLWCSCVDASVQRGCYFTRSTNYSLPVYNTHNGNNDNKLGPGGSQSGALVSVVQRAPRGFAR